MVELHSLALYAHDICSDQRAVGDKADTIARRKVVSAVNNNPAPIYAYNSAYTLAHSLRRVKRCHPATFAVKEVFGGTSRKGACGVWLKLDGAAPYRTTHNVVALGYLCIKELAI